MFQVYASDEPWPDLPPALSEEPTEVELLAVVRWEAERDPLSIDGDSLIRSVDQRLEDLANERAEAHLRATVAPSLFQELSQYQKSIWLPAYRKRVDRGRAVNWFV